MDWKLEGSAQKTESQVLQELEITLDDPEKCPKKAETLGKDSCGKEE